MKRWSGIILSVVVGAVAANMPMAAMAAAPEENALSMTEMVVAAEEEDLSEAEEEILSETEAEILSEAELQVTETQEVEAEQAAGDMVIDGNTVVLTQDTTVSSLTIQNNGAIQTGNYKLTVTGDVNIKSGFSSFEHAVIGGNFIVDGGSVRILGMEIAGSLIENAGFISGSSGDQVTIGGNLVAAGTLGWDSTPIKFSGSNAHTIDITGKTAAGIAPVLKNVNVDSGELQVKGSFGLSVADDMNIKVAGQDEWNAVELYLNGYDVTVNGNITAEVVNLDGGVMDVNGNAAFKTILVNGGIMTIHGNCIQNEGGKLNMVGSMDRLTITGDYTTYADIAVYKGVMTVGGDFIVGKGTTGSFVSGDTNQLVLSGGDSHLLSFRRNDNKSYIHNLQVDSGKVTVNNYLSVGKLNSDLNVTTNDTLYLNAMNVNGYSVTINGNVTKMGSGDIDLAAGTLTINGDFTQETKTVYVNRGKMTINGNYFLSEGNRSSSFCMKNEEDRVFISGNYDAYDTYSGVTMQEGIMTINGHMTVRGRAFVSSGKHVVKLTGDGVQRIELREYPFSKFNILYVSKPLATGYIFYPDKCWNRVKGHINVYTGFEDITEVPGNWKYDNVKFVSEWGVMKGIAGTKRFDPDSKLTRAMFATVLYRIAGNPATSFYNKFSDVKPGEYYSDAIIWAYQNEIVSGFQDGTFGIEGNITREQIAKMLYQYGKSQGYNVSGRASLDSFTDRGQVNGWATGYMEWAVSAGMISGKPNENGSYRLDPQGFATRAECAKMLTMFIKKYEVPN